MTARTCTALGAFLAGLGVMLGAFGAHTIRDTIPADRMAVYQTGSHYHLLHAIALFALGLGFEKVGKGSRIAAWLFTAGIVVFAGSLYALALTGIRVFGAITPIGGVCFISGWLVLGYFSLKA